MRTALVSTGRGVIKVLAAFVGASILTLAIVVAYDVLVPRTFTSAELLAYQEKAKVRGLTQEELAAMDRSSAEVNKEVRRRIKSGESLSFAEVRHSALIVSWLPWALIGLFALRVVWAPWAVGAALLACGAAGFLSVEEALAFAAATIASFYVRRLVGPRAPRHEHRHGDAYRIGGFMGMQGDRDRAVIFENTISRQLDPRAPLRAFSDHPRPGP
jgi:hypothetical protein